MGRAAPCRRRRPATRGLIGGAGATGGARPFPAPAGNSSMKRPSRRRPGVDTHGLRHARASAWGPNRPWPGRSRRRSGRPDLPLTPERARPPRGALSGRARRLPLRSRVRIRLRARGRGRRCRTSGRTPFGSASGVWAQPCDAKIHHTEDDRLWARRRGMSPGLSARSGTIGSGRAWVRPACVAIRAASRDRLRARGRRGRRLKDRRRQGRIGSARAGAVSQYSRGAPPCSSAPRARARAAIEARGRPDRSSGGSGTGRQRSAADAA